MLLPVPINFDWRLGISAIDRVVHLPKIPQGAPYSRTLRARTGDFAYRDFSIYTEIRMQWRTTQANSPIVTLTLTDGHFIASPASPGDPPSLTIQFPASITDGIPPPSKNAGGIQELPFVHDIELEQNGVVVERFAQGIGYLVMNTTRVTS